MAKNRSIKVVSQSGCNYKATPIITLKGQWLRNLFLILEIISQSFMLSYRFCRIVY